jgi:hypothetical protein
MAFVRNHGEKIEQVVTCSIVEMQFYAGCTMVLHNHKSPMPDQRDAISLNTVITREVITNAMNEPWFNCCSSLGFDYSQ